GSFGPTRRITVDGKQHIVRPTADAVIGYEPKEGRDLWRVTYNHGYSIIPRPVFGHGMIFFSTGYDSPQLMAVRAGGTGDVTDTHVVWKMAKAAPHTPSPLLVGTELYTVSDSGIATGVDAQTGTVRWQTRL